MSSELQRFEDFELDRSVHELRRNGCTIHIERIPLEFLCLLLERNGQIVTRSEIVERVWGKGVFLERQSSINTAMRKIRRALNDDFDPARFIVTVPGRGYRFIASVQTLKSEVKTDTEPVQMDPESVQTPGIIASSQAEEEKDPKSRRTGVRFALGAIAASVGILLVCYQWFFVPGRMLASTFSVRAKPPESFDDPSLVVLPFVNLARDREQDALVDGLTDDLINGFTRQTTIFVIARTSSFTYRGRATKAVDIGREHAATYLLEGSIHKSGDIVRVNTQLVDARTGGLLWAGRYDKSLRDIFALPDEIVQEIAARMNHPVDALKGGRHLEEVSQKARASFGCHDPASFGAVPDDGLDDTVPSQRALDAALVAGGQVCFGRGRWRLAPGRDSNSFAPLSIHGAHLEIRGTGPETVLEVVGDQGGASTGVISVNPGVHDVAIHDLTIDTSAATNTTEHFHAIDIGNGIGNGAIEDVRIENVRFDHPHAPDGSRKGDCVHIIGHTPKNAVRRVIVIGAMFARCARSDITVQKNVFDLFIRDNKFIASRDEGIDNDPVRRIDHHL